VGNGPNLEISPSATPWKKSFRHPLRLLLPATQKGSMTRHAYRPIRL